MRLLIYSMAFGLVHLFVGLGIKGYMLLKDGKVLDFFCDIVLWYIFLIGLILMLLPSEIFASIAQTKIVFPAALVTLSKALAIIGALGLLLMSGRSSKNPALRLALGAYDIYNITGWLSDVLSYSRLWHWDLQQVLSHPLSTRWEVCLVRVYSGSSYLS